MAQEAHKMWTLEELKGRTLKELLHEVAHSRVPMTVVLGEGESATIKPSSQLKPLLRLDGYVPEGWKNAVY